MVARSGKYIWNKLNKYWEDTTILESNMNGKKICPKCNKPQIDMNGVKNCDFCLQALTECELVDYACCGHGDDDIAYISFKDGRRWVLDCENSVKETLTIKQILEEMGEYDDR